VKYGSSLGSMLSMSESFGMKYVSHRIIQIRKFMTVRYILFGSFLGENGVENILPSIHEEFDISKSKYKLGFFLG
jgi:hypothetical protein